MMEFNTFNAETCPQQTGSRYHLFKNLTLRNQGGIMISRMSAADLGLTEQSRIVFLQDKRYPTDWYIQKTTDEKGYELRLNKNGSFALTNYPLVREIVNSTLKPQEPFMTITFPLSLTDNGLALGVKHPKITTKK